MYQKKPKKSINSKKIFKKLKETVQKAVNFVIHHEPNPKNTLPLKEMLLNELPKNTVGFNDKSEFEKKFTYEKTVDVIDDSKFIRFNTKKFTSLLIFDIDTFPDTLIPPNIHQMHEEFYQKTGFEPTWTVATDKGYHIALLLDKGVFSNHYKTNTPTKDYLAIVKIKEEITKIMNADPLGSHRTYGIWRNPIKHDCIYTGKSYPLDFIYEEYQPIIKEIFEKQKKITQTINPNAQNIPLKIDETSDNKILPIIKKGFYVGNRNNYIFSYGYQILFENRGTSFEELENQLQKENASYSEPLTYKEVTNITKSIYSYHQTMYKASIPQKRGKLSNEMWELGIHGISKRRAYAGWKTSKNRREETLTKIVNAILQNIETTNQWDFSDNSSKIKIAEEIEMSKKTIERYQKKYNLKSIIFLEFIKSMGQMYQEAKQQNSNNATPPIDIRPFVQKKIVEELKKQMHPFTPSDEVLKKDFERKKEYLLKFHPFWKLKAS